MRPSVTNTGKGVYECFGCGHRQRDPDKRVCPTCGSEMRNTGRERDL